MKFEKTSLFNAVKAKLTANGKKLSISDRTLNDMVNNHYQFVTEETELDDFIKQILPAYESLDGNYRKDNADFVKDWEKNHPTTPESKNEEDNAGGGDDATKKLLARIEALENERKLETEKRTLSDKVASIKSKAVEKGISNKEWLDSYMSTLAVNAESDVEQMAENALKLFNMSNAHVDEDIIPAGTGGGAKNEKDLFADIAEMRKPQE